MEDTEKYELDLYLKEYDILVGYIKYQHQRLSDYTKIFLTSNSIILAAIALIIKDQTKNVLTEFSPLLSLIGFIISLLWICVTARIMVESDLRWFQLRNTEIILGRPNGIFNQGQDLFENKKVEVELLNGIKVSHTPESAILSFSWVRMRFSTGRILPLTFIILYIIIFTVFR
ncbi:MAG: hypothetical protein WC405_09145 [Syntrophales bacterium]